MEKNRGFFLYVLNYAIVLFLIGMSMLAWFHAYGLERKLKENTALAVELKNNPSSHSVQNFEKWLATQLEIIPSSIHRIDSNEIKDLLMTEWKGGQMEENLSSQFPQIIIFKLKQEYLEQSRMNTFSEKIYKQEIVKHFTFQNELTQSLTAVLDRIKIGFLVLTTLFIIAGILISEYLAQVFVDFREVVIRKWNELGATQDKFIKPYLRRIVFLGLASACLSVCLLGIVIFLSYYLLPWVYPWIETKKFLLVMVILLILGPTLQYILVKRKILALLN